jgi:hypothetical protein
MLGGGAPAYAMALPKRRADAAVIAIRVFLISPSP